MGIGIVKADGFCVERRRVDVGWVDGVMDEIIKRESFGNEDWPG
jgi:hypothetical protein